ncbi:MAG: glycosyltransferase family 39 protein [Chloroflexi bacterium]|nr:glycosyltransferase family 39 protein [Chloroflexota bacterium]
MTEQARPFQNVNKIETLDTLDLATGKPTTTPQYPAETNGEERSVLDKLLAAGWFNWETVLWIGLMALAVFMHVVDLGPRAMHHDESIHAKFSYDMFRGISVYKYDPTFHGPLLYYMVSLSYFLFGGASETAARLAPAIYGIGLVASCYLLRPLIGRIGALAMGIFMLFSPSMLYYGRSLRHDIFATTGELLFVIGFFRFIKEKPGHKSWWLSLSGFGLVIIYSSHEMVFLNVGILVGWLILAFLFELVALPAWVKNRTNEKSQNLGNIPTTESEESQINPLNAEALKEELTTLGLADAKTETEKLRRVGDPILGKWGLVALVLFGLLTMTVVWGSLYLFKTPEGGSAPLAFNLPQWLVTIPFGLFGAIAIAYSLGGFLAYGFSRLEAKNVLLGRVVSLVSLVVLGAGGILLGLRTKAVDTTGQNPIPIVNGTSLGESDVYLLGMYVVPRIVFNLVVVTIVSVLVGLLVAWLWQRRLLTYTVTGVLGAIISFFAVMLIASLVSLRFIFGDKAQGAPKGGLFLVGPEVEKWLAYILNGLLIAVVVALFAGWLVSLADRIDDSELAGSAILRGVLRIARQPLAVGGFFLAFGIIYILLFSNFFFNLPGLADGIFRGIEYWGEQHGKRRLDQPWFYYPFMMLLYEILPVVFGFAALFTFPIIFVRRAILRGRCRFTVRGLFIGYSLWWSILATVVYSLAGEKAPWLNMQITLPVALSAAAFLDSYLRRIAWREFWSGFKGPLFALFFVLDFAAVGVVIGLFINFPSDKTQQAQPLIEALIVIVVGLGLFAYCLWLWWTQRVSGQVARVAIVMVIALALFGYTVKSTIALNYLHPDTANEILVYVQTTPEVPLFMQRLDRLSRDLRDTYKTVAPPSGTTQPDPTNSKGLPILLTSEVAWPLEWYLRDYTDKNYTAPNNTDLNTPAIPSLVDGRGNNYVVIAVSSGENTNKLQQQLQGQYTAHQYKFRWWFPEDDSGYGGLGKDITRTDWAMIGRSFTEQPYAGRLWRYVMYRELWNPLQSFDMVVYIRNDIDPQWGLYEGGSQGTGNQGQAFGLFDSSQAGSRNGQFRTPRDIALAPNGDILVLDSENARVQRFDKDGKFLSTFGGSGRDDGKFALAQYSSGPSGVTVDDEGNIYVADTWNFRIQKFDKDGKFLLKWGEGKDTTGTTEGNQQSPNVFYGPREMAYDAVHKELYIADTGNQRIVVYNKQGQFIRQFGEKGSTPGQFSEPVGVAVSPDGSKVYVTDLRNKRIQLLDRTGQPLAQIPTTWNDQQAMTEPYVKTDKVGNFYVTDPNNGRVYKYDSSYTQVNVYDSTKGIFLTNPVGLTFDSVGNLLVADAKRNAVVKIVP